MSGRIAKSQIPIRPQVALPPDALIALIEVKNLVRSGRKLKEFENDRGNTPLEGPPLPDPAKGCVYYEYQVGQTRLGERGSRRLVVEVNAKSRQILEVYFTEEHYGKFSFVRVV
jgi:hypothetical protein